MVAFAFDATEYKPSEEDTPATYAARRWMNYQEDSETIDDPATALALARYDRDVYEALQKWSWSQDVDALSIEWQAALGRALGRKPPRKGKGATARRDAFLRATADVLCRDYGLKRTQSTPGGAINCAASILVGLRSIMLSEGQIANILSGH